MRRQQLSEQLHNKLTQKIQILYQAAIIAINNNKISALKSIFNRLREEEYGTLFMFYDEEISGLTKGILLDYAVCKNDLQAVKFLLGIIQNLISKKLIEENRIKIIFESAIGAAVRSEIYTPDILAELLSFGKNYVNCNVEKGRSPLMIATILGRLDLMKLLIQAGANTKAVDDEQTPVLFGIYSIRFTASKQTPIDKKKKGEAEHQKTLTAKFDQKTQIEAADILLGAGVDVNTIGDPLHNTILHYCATGGLFDLANHLIKNWGAKLNLQNTWGMTPLIIAVKEQHIACIPILAEGAVNLFDNAGKSALSWAETPEAYSALVNVGAEPSLFNLSGLQAIHWYSFSGAGKLISLLLERGINVNSRTTYMSQTPLLLAVYGRLLPLVQLLCARGADLNAVGSDGLNSLLVAIEDGWLQGVQYLLSSYSVLKRYSIKELNKRGRDNFLRYIKGIKQRGAVFKIQTSINEAENEKSPEKTDNSLNQKSSLSQKGSLMLMDPNFLENLFQVDSEFIEVSALEFAIECNKSEIAMHLLTQAKKNEPEQFQSWLQEKGLSYFMTVIRQGDIALARAFVDYGFDIRKTDDEEITVLMHAFYVMLNHSPEIEHAKYVEMVIFLLEQSRKLNAEEHVTWLNKRNVLGANALCYAFVTSDVAMLSRLLEEGAEIIPQVFGYSGKFTILENQAKFILLITTKFKSWLPHVHVEVDSSLTMKILTEFLATKYIVHDFCPFVSGNVAVRLKGAEELNITKDNLQAILNTVTKALKEYPHQNSQKVVYRALLSMLPSSIANRQTLLQEEIREEYHALMLRSKAELTRCRSEVGQIVSESRKLSISIQAIIESHVAKLATNDYFKINPEKKVNHETTYLKWKQEIEVALEAQRKYEKNIFAYPLFTSEELKALYDLVNAGNIGESQIKLTLLKERLMSFTDTLIVGLKELKAQQEKLLRIQEEIQEQFQVETKLSQSLEAKAETKHDANKNGKNKKKKKKPSVALTNTSGGAASRAAAGNEAPFSNSAAAAAVTLSKSVYGSRHEELLTAINHYEQLPVNEEDKSSLEVQAYRAKVEAQSIILEDVIRPLNRNARDPGLSNLVGGQIDALDTNRELKALLEIRSSNREEEELEKLALKGALGQRLESLARLFGKVLPPALANHLRNKIFYTDRTISTREMRYLHIHLSRLLEDKKNLKEFESLDVLLKEIEPTPGIFTAWCQEKVLLLTPEVCEQRINAAILLWRQCRKMFNNKKVELNHTLLRHALGFIVATIGNFTAHLKQDWREAREPGEFKEKAEANMRWKNIQESCAKQNLNFDFSEIMEIGRKFRHLNLIIRHDTFDLAGSFGESTWQQDIDAMIDSWRSLLPNTHTALDVSKENHTQVNLAPATFASRVRGSAGPGEFAVIPEPVNLDEPEVGNRLQLELGAAVKPEPDHTVIPAPVSLPQFNSHQAGFSSLLASGAGISAAASLAPAKSGVL